MSATGRALNLLKQRPHITPIELARELWPKFMSNGETMRKKSVEAASLLLARLRKVPV